MPTTAPAGALVAAPDRRFPPCILPVDATSAGAGYAILLIVRDSEELQEVLRCAHLLLESSRNR